MKRIPMTTATLPLAALFAASLLFAPSAAPAADYYVAPGGSDSNPGSSASPWRTLQKAANSVGAGDAVHVGNGTYAGFQITAGGSATSRITFVANGSSVLVNQPNSSTPDNINVEGADYVVIDGFVVEDAPRVGIRAVQATGVVIRNNTVRRSGLTGILTGWTPAVLIEGNVCSASGSQHGIYVSNSNTPNDNPVLRNNECFGNAENGVQLNGDCWEGGDGVLEGALIEGNYIHDNNWKGFSLISVQASTIQNNVIADNGLSAGAGGIHLTDQVGPSCGKPSSNNVVVNNTIVEPRIACVRMTDGSTANVVFNNLCIASNTGKLVVDEVGGNLVDGASNLMLTSSSGLFVNATAKDFHLAAGSAAIDAGIPNYQGRPAPAVDRDDVARPGGARHDIGAYEIGGAPTGDVTPPAVAVTAPAANSTVSQPTTIMATATDNVMVASVEFFIDGASLGLADTQAPYAAALDPRAYPNGFYTLTARARDDAGNVATSPGVAVFLQNGTTGTGVLEGHPRLTLVGGRLQELRRNACFDDNGNRIPNCTPTAFATNFFDFVDNKPGSASAWHFALAYMVSGQTSYATQAIQAIDQQVTCGMQCIANANNTFLYVRDFMRNVCLVYDWCYARLTPQQRANWISYMNKALFVTWNETPDANAIYDTKDWATSNPNNNYFYNYILATTYVALATYGENPGTFVHNGQTYNVYYLMNARNASSDRYTDAYEFLMAKLNEQAFPSIDGLGVGGGWLEGENYGRAMKRHLFEAFLLLKQTAGLDYFNNPSHPFPRHAVHYEFSVVQPGDGVLYSGGDASQEPTLNVNDYDRHMMLLAAEGLKGTVESQYAQYWCNHHVTHMNGIPEMIPVDFFLQQTDLPERDFAELPTRYYAEGINWVNSRSSWASDAFSVTFTCTDRIEGHQHKDQNHFSIYIGGAPSPVNGWMLTDTQPYSSGLPAGSELHNTYVVGNTGQRFGQGTGRMVKYEAAATYTYAVGDASDAYYTNPGEYGHGDQKMVDVFQRELVHILPGYVVAFDRLSLHSGFTSSPVQCVFHYPYAKPTQTGGAWVATNGPGRLFQRVLLPESPSIGWVDEEGLDSGQRMQTWRMELKDATTRPSYQFLNVFLATRSSTASMAVTSLVRSREGQMVGAVIKDPAQEHVVMFSSDPTGASPVGSFSYDVGLDLKSLQQIFDLVPGLGYSVQIARRDDGYVVTVGEGGERPASEAGALSFTLEEILSPSTPIARR
jgi:Bacterial Ig domain/Periplasmic copper-binding protein (NosD)